MIRIYLVDDHAMLRAGLRSLLARDTRFEVVGDNGDPRLAIEECARLRPDVLLLDISMPFLSGIDAIPLMRCAHPAVKIVMLTHHEGDGFVQQALRAGADGYLSKNSAPEEIAVALEAVLRGDLFLSPRVTAGFAHGGHDAPPGTSRLESLTPREREVLQLLAQGRTNKEVAQALDITVGTTKKHRENLKRKLDCHSTAEMALLAVKEGLIDS